MGSVVNHVTLTHSVIVKSTGLLPMQYKLDEIADKLGMNAHTLSDWTDAGVPHTHDARGHIWIVGTEFAEWVEKLRAEKVKASGERKLTDDQAYCMRCRRPVDLINPVVNPAQGKLIYIKGICPTCGCTINRGGRKND